MHKNNEVLSFRREELAAVIAELSSVVVSLNRIGARYAIDGDRTEYLKETTRYIDEWRVTQRLARRRAFLTAPFDRELGADEVDELERAGELADYWDGFASKPRDR